MGLKKYILGTLILVLAIFAYTFSIKSGDFRIEIFDYSIVLPVALWVVAPMILLFVLSLLHMMYYGLKNYFALKAVSKDTDSMITLIRKRLFKENHNVSFQNNSFKTLNKIISQLDIDVLDNDFSCDNKELAKTVDQIVSIRDGKYISVKELKLPNDNPIMVKNLMNRAKSDESFALDAVKKSAQYNHRVVKVAFEKILETKSMTTIKKYIEEIEFDKDMLIALFKKDSEQSSEIAMTNEMILKLISKVEFSNKELINVAKTYKSSMTPDQIIKLYEDISSTNEEYTPAYLYVLSEYEMVDKMRDILVNSQSYEYLPFKALIDLKDAGKHTYSLETLCYK